MIMSRERPGNKPAPAESEWAYRRELIQGEFRKALTEGSYTLPVETDGVMVLSAPPSLEFRDDERSREGNPENAARIALGHEMLLEIAGKKLGKTVQELTPKDLLRQEIPPLILNGETEQLPTMRAMAFEMGVPAEKLILVDCGRRGVGNTTTQFQRTAGDPVLADCRHLTIVTSDYHEPRAARTAKKFLPEAMDFDVIGVPRKEFGEYDIYRKVRGEVKRITAYFGKSDGAK